MTSASIKKILVEFNLNGNSTQWTPLNNGLINDTYLVKEDNDEQYILQKKDLAVLLQNLLHQWFHMITVLL